MGSGKPLTHRTSFAFLAGQSPGSEQQQGKVNGVGIVLLVGGKGEKDQDDGSVDGEQPDGSAAKAIGTRGNGIGSRTHATQPSGSRGPRPPDHHREIDAPGKEPDQVQTPVENKGKFVVVDGITAAKKAQYLLVDEVEIEEAVHVAGAGNVAYGVACAGIAQSGEDVPWRGDGKEEENAREQAELTPAAPIAGEPKVRPGGCTEEDGGDQPFGQHGQRQGSPSQIKAEGFVIFEP